MRKISCIVFILTMLVSYSQGEANIWYFGYNAGLDFNSGTPVALTDGQLYTEEGCATISNAQGELLFYTDGITVYNRHHQIMVNGMGLLGHSSSAQSATVVPKPGSSNLYYIFTTDNEHDPNGFRYSVVDMSLDNGNGAITADEKNILIYTPTIENLGITKHANGIDYWIITHGWDGNNFITYLLTSSGLSNAPVITNIGLPVTGSGFKAAGTIKVSPSGSKVAFTSVSDFAQLFDFDNSTGTLSNEITLILESGELYGAAFSPDESVLYISNSINKIHQFDLNASDIPNSRVFIFNSSGHYPGQMQIGKDNKIYVAFLNRTYLAVINNPNVVGIDCDFVLNGVSLNGRTSRTGLPSFNQSFFFTPSIQLSSACEGESTDFTFSTNQTVLSAVWNFGDGAISSEISPTHTYSTAGNYTVSVTVTTPFGTGTNTREITIFPKPVLLSNTIYLKQCDDDNDGFSLFNLSEANQLVVNSTTGLTFTYFETLSEAESNTNPITNFINYENQTVSTDTVFMRIENENGCHRIATLNLIVSTTLIPSSFQRTFTVCDDNLSGSDTDGIATFDFSSVTSEVEALFPSGQLLDITYYRNIEDALAEQNAITDISNYTNIGYPNSQNIYIRVDSQLDNECLGLGHHITLNVEALPVIQNLHFKECDDDYDGIFGFDITDLENDILNGLTNITLSYWDENSNPLPSPLPNPFYTTSQTIKVRATNNTILACFYESEIIFTVDNLPEVFSIPNHLTTVCDDETNPSEQDGLYAFDTSAFQSTITGNQTGLIVNYYDEAGNTLPSPLPNPFVSGTQTIQVEVINSLNIDCKVYTTIPLIVNPVPNIDLFGSELICSDNPSFTREINAGLFNENTINSHSYKWFLNGSSIPSANNYSLSVNTEGIYNVEVSNNSGCISTRTITVTASNIATIENIDIRDLSNQNSVTVFVLGLGDYQYSLDNAMYQTSNVFENLNPGIYTVYVKDANGCGIATENIGVLGIPKFFTPNGDLHNDTWNIKGFFSDSKAIVSIYDRYGKLLKQFNPVKEGWDGTYNGQSMLSTDYWYSVQLENGKILKGHFSLIR